MGVAEAINLVIAVISGGISSLNSHLAFLLLFYGLLAMLVAIRDSGLKGLGCINVMEVAVATRQLATLVGGGITLVDALNALTEQVENHKFKLVLSQVKTRVNEGTSLADSLMDHPRVFSSLFINMIRAGESSGTLDVVLMRLADFTESQTRLRQKIAGTMTYPVIMLVLGLVIVAIAGLGALLSFPGFPSPQDTMAIAILIVVTIWIAGTRAVLIERRAA